VLAYLDGKRHRYAIEDKLRESLDDVFDGSESEETDGSNIFGGDSADSI